MTINEKSLSEFFKRIIFQGLEKIDVNQIEQRRSVYNAAFRSLDNVHSKNLDLSPEEKLKQSNLLSLLVQEVEKQIIQLQEEEARSALSSFVDNSASEVELSFELDDENSKSVKPSVASKLTVLFSKIKQLNNHLKIVILGILVAIGILVFYSSFVSEERFSEKLQLPYVLVADQTMLDSIKTKGAVKTQLIEGGQGGILYEVDNTNENKTNRLDVLLNDGFGKQLSAFRQPILITFHVEKKSKDDLQFEFMIRGIGKVVRKNVTIIDSNTSEYFLVTNAWQLNEKNPNTLIRLKIAHASEKSEEKPALLLKKIVFSKI